MGKGAGTCDDRAAVSLPTQYRWKQFDDVPLLEHNLFVQLSAKLDTALELIAQKSPQLGKIIPTVDYLLDATESREASAAYVVPHEDPAMPPCLVIPPSTVTEYSDEGIQFVLAHELTHVLLGHMQAPVCLPDGNDDWTVNNRMLARSCEPLVNDHVFTEGFAVPEQLKVNALSGDQTMGFSLLGLQRATIWKVINGEMTREDLRLLALSTSDEPNPDPPQDIYVIHPHPLAQAFWEDKRGQWQDWWTPEHNVLVEARRREL